jgi:FkbM family methyltransferase
MFCLINNWITSVKRYATNRNFRNFIRVYNRYSNFDRYREVKTRFLDYEIITPDAPSFLWQIKDIFVDESYLFESNSNEKIIIDCGSNIGLSCLYFKKLYPESKIYAFEADPLIFKYLVENINGNKIFDIQLQNHAVWINDNGIQFFQDGADGGSIYGEPNKNKINIPTVRLRDILRRFNFIDMVKIDIEGAELEILNDCKNYISNVQNIFIEYHSFNSRKQKLDEILKILSDNDFRYYLKTMNKNAYPFLSNKNDSTMDLQVNIYAYKQE